MPQTSRKPELSDLLTTMLGDLAFMIAEQDSAPSPPPGTIWLAGEIRYSGPVTGQINCWCTRDFAVQLAANLLGTDPDDPEALTDADDAVREFLNVLCGNLVTSWHGDEAVFNLSIATVQECLDVPSPGEQDGEQFCTLSVSDTPLYCVHRWQP